MHSQTWTPSHLPPHNISLGHPYAPAPSMLYPASDIDWRFNSYMIVYMLECHSPKSSHPLPLPLSPKVRYTHLCLFCCLAHRVVIARWRASNKQLLTTCQDLGYTGPEDVLHKFRLREGFMGRTR